MLLFHYSVMHATCQIVILHLSIWCHALFDNSLNISNVFNLISLMNIPSGETCFWYVLYCLINATVIHLLHTHSLSVYSVCKASPRHVRPGRCPAPHGRNDTQHLRVRHALSSARVLLPASHHETMAARANDTQRKTDECKRNRYG